MLFKMPVPLMMTGTDVMSKYLVNQSLPNTVPQRITGSMLCHENVVIMYQLLSVINKNTTTL